MSKKAARQDYPRISREAAAGFRRYAEALERDGAALIPGALDANDLSIAQKLFEWTCAHPGQSAQDIAITDRGETVYTDTYSNVTRDYYREILKDSTIPAIMAAVLGVDQLWYLGEQVLVKRGESETRPTPWHQDTDMPINQVGTVGMWMTFDKLDLEHSLHFVRGSNHWPRLNPYMAAAGAPGEKIRHLYPYEDARHMPPFPNIDLEPEKFDLISWPCDVGDVILFHNMTIHGGAPVPPSGLRRTLCLRFFGPETRYEALPRRQSTGNLAAEATEHLWRDLEEGQPLHQAKQFFEVFQSA
jgi:hypothetical protein